MSKPILIILLLTLLVNVACEKETPTKPAPPMASSVTISPASATIEMIGQTIQLTATVKDQYGDLFTSATVSWSSRNPQVVTVDDLGLATARKIGSTAVSAEVGNAWSSAEIVVRGPAAVAYMTQATQSLAHPVPLVAEKPALLRVFFFDDAAYSSIPSVRAKFYHSDALVHTVDIPGKGWRTFPETGEASLLTSTNALIPGWVIVPGLEMVIEVDPDFLVSVSGTRNNRIPQNGRTTVDVRQMPPFNLTIVPILREDGPNDYVLSQTEGLTADSELFRQTRDLLPIGEFNVTVREPLWTSLQPGYSNRIAILHEVNVIRQMDGIGGYYMGMMRIRGAAAWPGHVTLINFLPWNIVHELGHNLSLGHAPCGTSDFLDTEYPFEDGSVGSWGYDISANRLVSPQVKDLMSYCDGQWIGSYNFAKALNYRWSDRFFRRSTLPLPRKTLLLWGSVNEDSELSLEPAFVVNASPSVPPEAGPYYLAGEDEDGQVLFTLDFDMIRTAEGDGNRYFVFTLPVRPEWAIRLSRISLSGPEGSVSVVGAEGPAAALLLDTVSGKARGIFREWSLSPQVATAARRVLPETGLKVLISGGIPDPSSWK